MIYLTGDTHIPLDVEKLNTRSFPEQKKMTRDDYVIVLGDFGLLWHEDKEYYWWKRWFEEKNFTTLWIDGNHENHNWIDSLPVSEWYGGKVHMISPNIIHLMRGQVFTIEDNTFFTFGGALSIDKEMRRENVTWWAREEASYAEQEEGLKNLEKYNNKVDYILTHTCPDELINIMFPEAKYKADSVTGKYLDYISKIASYRKWYFGHWHVRREMGKFLVLYNTIEKLED